MTRRRSAVAISLEQKRAERAAVPDGAEALYGVALLKLALELKKPGAPGLEALVPSVVKRLGLDESAFRAWMDANGGMLRAASRRGK